MQQPKNGFGFDTEYFVIETNKLSSVLKLKGVKSNNSLFIDSINKQLEIKLDSDYLTINASNQLSPMLKLKGVNFPFSIKDTTKLLLLKYNVDNLKINSINQLDSMNLFTMKVSWC
jgi:hypothetical protein